MRLLLVSNIALIQNWRTTARLESILISSPILADTITISYSSKPTGIPTPK